MIIWVDADACPNAIKQILYRVARRTGKELILVANHFLQLPNDNNIHLRLVEKGFDVADNYICQHANEFDIAVTGDIPLASELVALNVYVVNPRPLAICVSLK